MPTYFSSTQIHVLEKICNFESNQKLKVYLHKLVIIIHRLHKGMSGQPLAYYEIFYVFMKPYCQFEEMKVFMIFEV